MWKLLLVFPFCGAGLVTGCRSYTPVERHFLRVPALSAAALAGPDRAKWLKNSRRQDPLFQQGATENHWFALSSGTRPPQVQAPQGEVRFFPQQPGSPSGVVALNWETGDPTSGPTRLYLLRTQGARYLPLPLESVLPGNTANLRFSLGAEPDAITAYRQLRAAASRPGLQWRKVAVLRWQPPGWKVERVAENP